MSRSPHTQEFNAMVSQEYVDGTGSYEFLANKYRIGSSILRQWVASIGFIELLPFKTKKEILHIQQALKCCVLKQICLEMEALTTL